MWIDVRHGAANSPARHGDARIQLVPYFLSRVLLSGVSLGCILLQGALAEEIRPAADRPQPKTPEQSARCVQLPPGFRLDLVAAEPLVRDPAAITFDESGRLFVCEIHGYNLDGYLDIVELNKSGRLDREVRRVRHATPAAQQAALQETFGTVKLLRDVDNDGRMDVADVWADRLPPCYGLIPARGGLIAICAPDIVFLADRDGDGRAEVRETLFTGFARELIERGISNPRQGPDNWIYVAAGGGGGVITGPRLQEPVTIGHTDFRIRPDGSAIEPVTGRESMFGLTMTDFGDRFHTIISWAAPLPHRNLLRNPYLQSPPGDVSIVPSRELFPISEPDPWRKARGQDPAWVRFYGEAETQPNGQFTASSGQLIYRAESLPEAYRGNYFVCDPANNLVHRSLLERDGMEYVARRAPENARSEFLASTDQWFRPVNLSLGPEGAMYVVDMYREIIEDFSAIPRYLQQQYAESLVAGQDYGRIWRVSWQGERADPQVVVSPVRLDSATVEELVPQLDHPNAWWRETAQRLLVERGVATAAAPLARLVRNGKTPQGRMHALYALEGLARLEPADVRHALDDESWGVRMHALRLAERWLNKDAALLDRVLEMTGDAEPRVRLQVALTLGESGDPRAIEALAGLAASHGEERWMSAAIASSIADHADAFLERLLAPDETTAGIGALLAPVAETIGARREGAAIGRLLEQTAALTRVEQQLALLEGLARGLDRGGEGDHDVQNEQIVRGLERLLAGPSADVSQYAVRVFGLLKLRDSPEMQEVWGRMATSAFDDRRPLAARLEAVALLSVAPWPRQERLGKLLDVRYPAELQLAAVKALGRADHADVSRILLANWTGLVPGVQEVVADAHFARQDRLPQLLDAIERGVVSAATLSVLRREQLIEHGTPKIRQRARRLLASRVDEERSAVLERYQSALTLARDPTRGEAVFAKNCARCHRLGTTGHEVGPDLLAARTRPDETLLVDVLDPSSAIAHGYTVYAVATTDGRVHTGLLAGETATGFILRNAAEAQLDRNATAVVETSVLRRDIEEMRTLSKSLMPDGFEKELAPQDMADLIGYLRRQLGPLTAPGVVLFDDEAAFLALLDEGGAQARLTADDRHSGESALLLTAGQRFSARIPGWKYRIRETTATVPGAEPAADAAGPDVPATAFRYLRFAWKSAGATGVMIELADEGSWPPADRPTRRYYSGQNTSGWAATEVSPDVPTEWTVVTVDLWKDFGEFTLTGIAPTALGGPALFDRIELLHSLTQGSALSSGPSP